MDLKSKFERGKASRTFQRIDSTYAVNIFVGFDDDGRMTVVITENSIYRKWHYHFLYWTMRMNHFF